MGPSLDTRSRRITCVFLRINGVRQQARSGALMHGQFTLLSRELGDTEGTFCRAQRCSAQKTCVFIIRLPVRCRPRRADLRRRKKWCSGMFMSLCKLDDQTRSRVRHARGVVTFCIWTMAVFVVILLRFKAHTSSCKRHQAFPFPERQVAVRRKESIWPCGFCLILLGHL